MGLCIFVSGFNKEGLISVRVMEKKRFEKTCSSADQKTFCIYCVLEIMLQNAEMFILVECKKKIVEVTVLMCLWIAGFNYNGWFRI